MVLGVLYTSSQHDIKELEYQEPYTKTQDHRKVLLKYIPHGIQTSLRMDVTISKSIIVLLQDETVSTEGRVVV